MSEGDTDPGKKWFAERMWESLPDDKKEELKEQRSLDTESKYRVTLEDSFGTCWDETVSAASPERAMQKAESEAPGSGDPTPLYAVNTETGERSLATDSEENNV